MRLREFLILLIVLRQFVFKKGKTKEDVNSLASLLHYTGRNCTEGSCKS